MHRIRTIVAGTVGLLLSATAVGAQGTGSRPFDIGLLGGAAIPVGDLADEEKGNASVGFALAGFVGFRISETSPIKLRAEVGYNRFGSEIPEDDEIPVGDVDANWSITSVTGNAVFMVPTQGGARPYLIGGLGWYQAKFSAEAMGLELSIKESGIGFNGGAGIEFPLSGLTTFIEARFHTVKIDAEDDEEGPTDARLSFVPITFGIRF